MKCHAGVDAGTGLIHTIGITPANTHDITVASKLIRSDDEVVYGDSGYIGIQKRPEIKEDEHLSAIDDGLLKNGDGLIGGYYALLSLLGANYKGNRTRKGCFRGHNRPLR